MKSHPPRSIAPKLSGMTYDGRGIAGVEEFAGETAFFRATARDANGRHNLSFLWSWGDGMLGCPAVPGWACRGASAAHIYRRPGTYTVTLTVADRTGASVTGRIPITIHAPPPRTVFTAVRALGSSIATSSQSRGAVTTTLVLPSWATSVVGVTTIPGCDVRMGFGRPPATARP